MKGNPSLLIGMAAFLVAAAVIAVKMSGGGEAEVGAAKSGMPRSGPGGKAAERENRLAGRGGGARQDVPVRNIPTLSSSEASKQAKVWMDDILQLTGPEKREEALDAMKAALESGDEMAAYSALQAYVNVLDVKFDRAAFRSLVEPHLEAVDPGMRRAAWYAFANTEQHPEDLERVRRLAQDPAVALRRSASHLMALYEKRDFTGESGSVVLGMLNVEEQPVRREVLRGLWGARFSPELEAKVIELSRSEDRSELHDAVYFSLSTQANKSPASVTRLIEVLSDPDVINNAGRAAWGLRQGVPQDARAQVADAALGLLEARRSGPMWNHGIDLIGRYGTEAHRAALEVLASDPNLDGRSQTSLQSVLQKLK